MKINTIITQQEYLAMSSVLGESATINDNQATIIVGNSKPNERADTKTIRTLTPLACGDLITYKAKSWLVISEVAGDRHTIYRGLMRSCNFSISVKVGEEKILIGYDEIGRPVYETVDVFADFPCIVDSVGLEVDSNQIINISKDKITIIMQDNQDSRTITLNAEITVMGQVYTIQGVDLTRPGLITFTAKVSI